MRIWIDCEFNSFRGELISMALVAEDGQEFYAVLEATELTHPWVLENVVPVLQWEGKPISRVEFQYTLQQFLMGWPSVHLVADWPDDIRHFCESLITAPGERLNTPPLTMEIVRDDTVSKVPHNALWDARAMRDARLGR